MPVIAESPPLIFGGSQTTDPSEPSIQPQGSVVISPPAQVYIQPTESCNLSTLLDDHRVFVERIEQIGACFKRTAMPEFSDVQFQIHTDLSLSDKYLTKSGDMYCSKQAVVNLSQKLSRYKK